MLYKTLFSSLYLIPLCLLYYSFFKLFEKIFLNHLFFFSFFLLIGIFINIYQINDISYDGAWKFEQDNKKKIMRSMASDFFFFAIKFTKPAKERS